MNCLHDYSMDIQHAVEHTELKKEKSLNLYVHGKATHVEVTSGLETHKHNIYSFFFYSFDIDGRKFLYTISIILACMQVKSYQIS